MTAERQILNAAESYASAVDQFRQRWITRTQVGEYGVHLKSVIPERGGLQH